MADKEFVDGLHAREPHENAPDFIKCTLSVERKTLGNWLRGRSEEWINLDVKESKDGSKWYVEVNAYVKPDSATAESPAEIPVDDIPF